MKADSEDLSESIAGQTAAIKENSSPDAYLRRAQTYAKKQIYFPEALLDYEIAEKLLRESNHEAGARKVAKSIAGLKKKRVGYSKNQIAFHKRHMKRWSDARNFPANFIQHARNYSELGDHAVALQNLKIARDLLTEGGPATHSLVSGRDHLDKWAQAIGARNEQPQTQPPSPAATGLNNLISLLDEIIGSEESMAPSKAGELAER